MNDLEENDLEFRKELIQTILAAAFIIVVITGWTLTR
jgi:hypothetical protein